MRGWLPSASAVLQCLRVPGAAGRAATAAQPAPARRAAMRPRPGNGVPSSCSQEVANPMATRVGINGFGRIGRQTLKAMLERHPGDVEVVAVNDITDTETNAHLFRYDTTYGRFNGTVAVVENDIVINGQRIKVFAQKEPGQIPW